MLRTPLLKNVTRYKPFHNPSELDSCLFLDKDGWQAVVNAVMNLWVRQIEGNSLSR